MTTQHHSVLLELAHQRQEELEVEAAARRLARMAGDRPWRRWRSPRTEARHRAGTLVPCGTAVAD